MRYCVFRFRLSHSADKTALSGGASKCDDDRFRLIRFTNFTMSINLSLFLLKFSMV